MSADLLSSQLSAEDRMAGVFDLELSEDHETAEEFEVGDDAIEVDQVRSVSTCDA